ncbi:ergosterol biosynthesis ERG4/ERG24 [Nitzschia inconspicua]|uniref:Delta(14)-sterol reductase n=1 Tax=Nitzschia inconspicua TaxID=303405 RepID=A0A9K3L591_9STRA|nr:ergosterol biosynthesis ERG4/ERG24 [Nitzschia inconspicua]
MSLTGKATLNAKTGMLSHSNQKIPTTHADEFGGPFGTLLTTLALPVLVLVLAHWAKKGYLDLFFFSDEDSRTIFCPSCDNLPLLLKCAAGLCAWFLALVILWALLPGLWVEGAPVHGNPNHRLPYKLNGHLTFWVVIGSVVLSRLPLNEYLYRYYENLAFADIALCFLLAGYLYISSFAKDQHGKPKVLSIVGNSGNAAYDFFMGRELNPRIGRFDWKQFCELRPGLILWVLLNYACAQQQYKVYGKVSGSMVLLNVFHAFYVWDSLHMERAILTTMDITTDGFGFMLVFGDLAWVPFTYNHPAKYLVHHDPNLSTPVLAAIFGLYVLGFYIFRAANSQKDMFRSNPNDPRVAHLTYMPTKRGTRLLTSGWWGMARKINYTGDYLMGLTYSLLCGFDSIVPYYYAVYFCILLVHRSIRDDVLCQDKYGKDWDEYKRQVPYRFIPGIV